MTILTNQQAPTFGQAVPIPWERFKAEIAPLYSPPIASKKHAGRFRHITRELEALGVESTADLTIGLITRFIASRPPELSPHSLQSLLNVVRSISNLAVRSGYLHVSPFHIRPISKLVRTPPLTGKRTCTREEIHRLLELARKDVAERSGWSQWRSRRLLAVLATAAYTGMRAGEVLRLRLDDIDLVNRIIHVRPHGDERLKTVGSEAPIALPSALVPILTDWLAHRLDRPRGFTVPVEVPYLFPTIHLKAPWLGGQGTIGGKLGSKPLDRLRALGRRCGVDVTFQRLRKSWCTIAEGAGVPQALITRQARHASEATTKRFYQARQIDALKDAVDGFDF